MSTKYRYKPDYAVHPGETLREKLEELGMTPKELAVRAGKPVKTISEILNSKSSITPEMAVQFEKVLNIPANFWIKKQANYNEFVAKERYKKSIEQAKDWAKQFPYAQMAKLGIVKATRKIEEKVEELFDFFDIAKHTAWENIYLHKQIPVFFRISLKHDKNPYALSVLLRLGEIGSKKIQSPKFNKTELKKLIPVLRQIMIDAPENFAEKIQEQCLMAGVKVIYTPNFKQTVTNGIVRWIDGNPIIQMTDRYKKYDIFWFSFFHEIGHILLHGNKKNVFIEESSATAQSKEEKEADNFAENILLPEKEYLLIKNTLKSERDILPMSDFLAKKHNTHRDIILGRFLKEDKSQKYKYLYGVIRKVDFEEILNR